MIEDINERMTQFAPSQNNPLNDDPIAEEIAIARQVTPQPDAATIDVDPIAEEIAQSRRDLMMATFGSAADANPDHAAQAKKLGEQFGVGADIAGRNMQQLKKQALLDELERRDLMRRDPILARYLSNHDFAAMAHDDIDNLAKTEDLFQGSWFARYEDPIAYGKKTISMIDERFRRGRAIVEMGRANDLLGLRAQWSPDPRKASEISEELKKLTTEGGIVGAGVEVVGQMLEGIPEVAETTAMGATAGGAVGAVGGPAGFVTIPAGMLTGAGAGFAAGSARSAFMAESGNSYQQMIEQGYDPEVARKAAIGVGVVNASIEMISFGALGPVLRKLGVNVFRPAVANALAKPTAAKALATLGSDYAKAVAAGASEEFLQEIATGIGDDIARVYGSSSPSRILDEGGITDLLGTAIESGVQGAMGMAILGGIGPVANFRYDMRRAGAAERQQAFFERLSANAVDSKLRGRDMNAFERFVASQAEGTDAETIFVDAAAMQGVLRQSNLSDEQIDEALPGVREQLQAAAQTGGDVTLPTASFAARVAGTDLGNAMLPHVRLAPDAMSVTEAQEFQKNRDQLVEQARVIMEEKGRADDAFVQEARAIEDRIYQEVVATGTMDENAARANATFVRDLYVTMAARMNTTPAALEQRFPYRVEAQGVAITEQLEQAVLNEQTQRWLQSDVMIRPADPRWEAARPFGQFPTLTAEGRPRFEGEVTQASLAEIVPEGRTVFHETNLNGVKALISRILEGPRRHAPFCVSDSIDLALGQAGRGYIIELDPQFANGQQVDVTERKPGLAMTEAAGAGTELRVDKTLRQSLRSVIVPNQRGLEALRRVPGLAELLDFDNPAATERGLQINRKVAAAPRVMEQAATMDAEYLAAVERGDMTTAQRMVDEAAERAMPNSLVRTTTFKYGEPDAAGRQKLIETTGSLAVKYHGGKAGITQFTGVERRESAYGKMGKLSLHNQGIWLANNPGTLGEPGTSGEAAAYANNYLPDAQVYPLFVNITNPKRLGIEQALDYTVQELKAQGHDGAYIIDTGAWIAFSPEQVKLADSVVRDAQGNVIPLSRRFDITSPRIFEQAAVPTSLDAVANVESAFAFAGTRAFKTNREFKQELQDRVVAAAKEAGIDLSKDTPEVEQYLVRVAVADAITALRTNPNAVGWYNEKVTKALRLVSLIHPEIATDPRAKFAFTWALAVTSNGLEVNKNFQLAERVYREYKQTGQMPTNVQAGQAQIAINASLGLFNDLVAKYGIDAVEKFMTTKTTVKEVMAYTNKNVSGENLTTEVYGAAALGPKIGNGFFANLYGYFEQLTMDRWLMRTWGRWTGTLLDDNTANIATKRKQLTAMIRALSAEDKKALEKILGSKLSTTKPDEVAVAIQKISTKPANRVAMAKVGPANADAQAVFSSILGEPARGIQRVSYGDELRKLGNALAKYLDGQKEAPSGPPERARIRRVMSKVLAELQTQFPSLTMSDLQALLWYPEKRLYDAAKTADEGKTGYEDNEAPDYANAAANLARASGVAESVISDTIASVDAELSAISAERAAGAERGIGNLILRQDAQSARAGFEQSPVTPGFYSALEREVAAIDAKALTASGWAERFKGLLSKGAINADELEWSGLNDYLKMQEGKVSKDAVLEFLRGNGVRVQTIRLADEVKFGTSADPADVEILDAAGLVLEESQEQGSEPRFYYEYTGDILPASAIRSRANRGEFSSEIADAAERVVSKEQAAGRTRFRRYTLPGGVNYREIAITLAGEEMFVAPPEHSMGRKADVNRLVHVRLTDRFDSDGKRVLFVEEVQSDWGQAGRKKGLASPMLRSLPEGTIVYQKGEHPTETNVAVVQLPTSIGGRSMFYGDTVEQATAAALSFSRPGQLPRAPFVETTEGWLNLGLKQIMLEAVRGNYDRVAFVNGEQSANRYDLSKQVDAVNVSRGGGTTWEIWADKDGQMVVRKDVNTIEEVEEVLGKELAAKVADMKPGESARTFSGVDLKVGGEGMKAFYDKIVPIAMGKLLKKYGGVKLGSVMLPNMRQQEMEADADRMGMTIEDVLDVADESEYAQAQPGFDITPEMVKKLESGLPLFQAAPGPARGGFDPSRLTTILNKNADLSTFIHETAHFYLTILGNLAADPAATPEIRADMDTLLKWFGIAGDTDAARLAAWNAMSVDQQRKYHEQFAYSFEVYMFEGKSPSAEMQGLFDRFSAWLKRVYRSIRDDLNAIYRREFGEDLPLLTGEVRQVMDRMLASEEQIKRQAAINEMKPMFQTQEQSGMDDAEWAAYQQMQQEAVEAAVTDMNKASLRQMQWLSNARARILRDLQAKHAKQRKEIREEVAEEIRRQPLYRAMEYLRTGTFTDADGEAVKMEGAHRLDMESVRQMYELEPENLRPDIAKLGTGGRGMMGMNGIDPDVAAELFGFSSGDELIRALIEAQPMKEAIDARTDEVMLERFSELSTPEGREAKVQESLHNEARARFVAVELRFVAKATQPARVLVEAAKQAAREMIAGKRIADLRPSEFIAAEARAARSAAKIGKPVNVDTVAKAAETRAMNIAREQGLAPDEVMAAGVEAGAIAQQAAQARLDEQRAQYGADPAQALIRAKRAQLYQNQLAAEALSARDEVEKGVRYLRQVMRDSNVKRMGADVADQIDRILERFNLRPMSAKRMAERQSLVQWLESLKESGLEPDLAPEILDEAARKPYREMTVAEFRDLVDAVKQLEYIGKNAQKIKRAQEMAEFEEVRDEIVASVRGNFTGKETKPRSPTTAMGKRIAKAKRFLYSHLKAAAIARIMDGGQDDGPVWNFLIRTANEAGDMETRMRAEATKRLTEILAPVFALGKMGGKGIYFETVGMSLNREARLVIALNMGNDGNRQRLLDGEGWTLEQVQPILESLTEAEWKAVQDVWDYMESFRPLVGAKERRLYGREPKWVTPVPFTVRTADGKEVRLSGGYYPIKYDPVATERAETADEAEKARTELRGAYTAATTRRSFTKARAAKVEDRPLLYTMTGVYSGINDVIHDLAWHEWLIQANRLMRDEKFDRAVRETYGAEFKSQLKGWIKDVAAGERGAEDAADMFASYIRRSVSAAGLGFNIVSAILQVTGFSQSIVRVGAKHVARGVAAMAASPLQTMKFVNEKSSFMQERARTQFRELNELRNMVGDESAAQRRLRLGTYFLMMRMQRMVDVPTWVGAYEKALEAGKDDATAVALADQAVIDSQGSGMLKDLSKIERGGALSKLFTVFYSYMNTVYNMAAVSTMTPRSKGRLAADYAMLFIVPVVLNYALKKALTPDVDDEEPDMEKIATDLVAEELSFLMGTMVGVREFQNAANAVVGKETAARGYEGPAGLRAIGEVGRFAVQAKQAEFDRAFRRSAINMLGIGLGLPSAQINRTIDGVEALAEGETENPFAVLTGVQR